MSQMRPSTRFSGSSNPNGADDPEEGWGKVAFAGATFLFAPIPLLVALGLYVLFQVARISYKVFLIVTGVYWLVFLGVFGLTSRPWTMYFQPYLDLVSQLEARDFDLQPVKWILMQAPVGIGVGLLFGTLYTYYRWIRRPVWEESIQFRATPWEWMRRRKTVKQIENDENSPTDGMTLGISPDGRRLVQPDFEAAAHAFMVGSSGSGKALDVSTPIPTPDGFTLMGDLQVGDLVLDERGNPTEVVGAFDVMLDHPCYEVLFSDGQAIVADQEHLWAVVLTGHNGEEYIAKVMDTTELRWVHNSYRNTLGVVLVDGGFTGTEVRRVMAVTSVPSRPVRCIAVAAPSHLFLAGINGVPTHNTSTLLIHARDAIKRGHGYVYVDLKGGADVPVKLAEYAARYGRRFMHFAIQDSRLPYSGPADGPAYYDPAGRGDPSRRKDLLVGAKKWDVEYYKQVVANYLQTAFRVSAIVPPQQGVGSFEDLVVLLQPDRLADRAARIPVTHRDYPVLYAEVDRLVNGSEAQERSGIRSMLAYIQTFVGSTAGAWLRKDPEGLRDIDFRRCADEGWVVCFSLDSSNYEESSAAIAGLVVQDLKTLSSELRSNPAPRPMNIVLDEFQAIGSDNVLGLIDKCRDANMPVIMSTQAIGNLTAIDDSFVDRVIGIVNCFMIHRANSMADAEIYAGLTGMEKKYKKTIDVEHRSAMVGGSIGVGAATGAGRVEEYDEFRVLPKDILELGRGQMVYVAKSPNMRVVYPVDVILENANTFHVHGPIAPGYSNVQVGLPTIEATPEYANPYQDPYQQSDPYAQPAAPTYQPDPYARKAAQDEKREELNQALGEALSAIDRAPDVAIARRPGGPLTMWGDGPTALEETLASLPDPSSQPAPQNDTPRRAAPRPTPASPAEPDIEFDPFAMDQPIQPLAPPAQRPAAVAPAQAHPAAPDMPPAAAAAPQAPQHVPPAGLRRPQRPAAGTAGALQPVQKKPGLPPPPPPRGARPATGRPGLPPPPASNAGTRQGQRPAPQQASSNGDDAPPSVFDSIPDPSKK